LGVRIRALREAKGLTQTELGARIGKQQSVVGKYEREEVDIPFGVLVNIAQALHVEIIDLFRPEAQLTASR
jgi:transcriptional regulator with XRE-family HTH domain